MRTRTLILSAAALVAGVASSVAQSNVYSVNVVGYVNQVFPAGERVLVANPLDNGTNTLNSVFGSLPGQSVASIWTGSGFSSSTKFGAAWSVNFDVPPGVGVFINSKSAWTNTYVGSVIVNVGESITNTLPAGQRVLVGSMIPYAGTINDTNLNLALPGQSIISTWNGTGYDNSTRFGTTWSTPLQIDVAEGFFVNSKSEHNWVQTLPAN